MIQYPKKRVIGLIGAPRAGKDTVANFLQESRNFVPMAFADKIKEECGISLKDFEAAKIGREADDARKTLWEFSARKRKNDPEYFIRLVMDSVSKSEQSVVITDIRTEDEFYAVSNYKCDTASKIYMIDNYTMPGFKHEVLIESKLSHRFIVDRMDDGKITPIFNDKIGLYRFYKKLEHFFFKEDIMDLIGPEGSSDNDEHKQTITALRTMVSDYIAQFEVREKI